MKKAKKIEPKWYLFIDGKNLNVVNTLTEVSQLKGAIIEITANEAATILALVLETKEN